MQICVDREVWELAVVQYPSGSIIFHCCHHPSYPCASMPSQVQPTLSIDRTRVTFWPRHFVHGNGKWGWTMDTQKGTGEEHTQAKVRKCCSSLRDWIGASQTQKTSLYKGIFRGPGLFALCPFKESIFMELRRWRLCAHQVLLCSIQSTALRLYKTWAVVNEDRGMQSHHFVN